MAQWGVAMTHYHPLWAPPNAQELAAGRAAAWPASALAPRVIASGLHRGYRCLLRAGRGRDQGAGRRLLHGNGQLAPTSRRMPRPRSSSRWRCSVRRQRRSHLRPAEAGRRDSERPPEDAPEASGNPSLLIHAFDYPALASLALPAARSYAKTAPASPHALHMPSHIFTRLGLWDECIASNLESSAAGKRVAARAHPGAASFDALHAMDYLEYAYLQQGKDTDARKFVDEVRRADRFDEPNFAAAYALVAIPARYALERRDWRAAATLPFPTVKMPWHEFVYVRGVTDFANAIGASRTNDLPRARQALASLSATEAQLAKQPPAGPYDWAGQVASMRLAAAGWIAAGEGRADEAVRLLTEAAEREEAVGKHPVTPGAILPAREQLGDLLLELKRPADALAAYERSLADAPKRFNTLAGAARERMPPVSASPPAGLRGARGPLRPALRTSGGQGGTVVPIAAVSRGGAPSAESATI